MADWKFNVSENDMDMLSELRRRGVKHITFSDPFGSKIGSVEFFEQKVPTFAPLDLDTIVPERDPLATDDETETRAPKDNVPPALARLLRQGSVS